MQESHFINFSFAQSIFPKKTYCGTTPSSLCSLHRRASWCFWLWATSAFSLGFHSDAGQGRERQSHQLFGIDCRFGRLGLRVERASCLTTTLFLFHSISVQLNRQFLRGHHVGMSLSYHCCSPLASSICQSKWTSRNCFVENNSVWLEENTYITITLTIRHYYYIKR